MNQRSFYSKGKPKVSMGFRNNTDSSDDSMALTVTATANLNGSIKSTSSNTDKLERPKKADR